MSLSAVSRITHFQYVTHHTLCPPHQYITHQYFTQCGSTSHITCHISHITPHASHITHHTSSVTLRTSHFTHHTSRVTHHTSHFTLHTSHITHHTSRFTHHTSHFTHHASHITHHVSHFALHTSMHSTSHIFIRQPTALYSVTSRTRLPAYACRLCHVSHTLASICVQTGTVGTIEGFPGTVADPPPPPPLALACGMA